MTRSFAPRSAGEMNPKQRWLALAVLAGSLLLVMMDMTILIMALPALVAELSPTAAQQLWIVDIYSLILAGLLIPMSALADRIGRKKVLMTGFALFGLVSILVLVAYSASFVILLRALLGAAGAMIMPTTLSMIRTIFRNPIERARALAIWSVVAGLGAIIGPLVGGTLLQFFNWHAAFLVNVPFVLLALIGGFFLLPEAKDPNPPRWDMPATFLSIGGMAGLVWGIKELAKHGLAHLPSWGIVAASFALLAWFVLRCLRRPEPLLDLRLFRSGPFTAGTIAAFTSSLGMAGMMLLVAQWLQSVAGFSPIVAGAALLPMAAGSLVTAPVAPNLAMRFGACNVVGGGLAVAGVGLVVLYFITGSLDSYAELVVPLAFVGAGSGALAIASAIIMGATPDHKAGNAATIEESMYDLGNVFGIALLGSIAAAVYRSNLAVADFAERLTDAQIADVEESVVGGIAIAEQADVAGLAQAAADAFETALGWASLLGGVLLLVAAVVVYILIPRSYDISTNHHG